jgi:hypothetical protein
MSQIALCEDDTLKEESMNKKVPMLIASLLVLTACASEPTIDRTAELTFDGLAPVKNGNFREAWADPDIDFSQYSKIMLGDAQFEFRAVKKTAGSMAMRRSSSTEFWIDDANRAKLVETVTSAFATELANTKGFTITDKPGPDTLILVGALHDIVSRVPPELIGRGDVYLASLGEATLVLQAMDSLSGETIYRAVDRRNIERMGDVMQANSVTTWSEVRRWAQRWAVRLRQGLESIHDQA